MRNLLITLCLLGLVPNILAQVSLIKPPSGSLRIEGHLIVTNTASGLSTNILNDLSMKMTLGGQIGGTLASPDIRGVRESDGTLLSIGAISDGQTVIRSGLTLAGSNPSGTGDVIGLNTLTNGAPLLGAGTKSIIATNASGFRAAVGLVIGTDVQAQGNYLTGLTGDMAASGPGNAPATLANTAVTPGTFGSATKTVTVTVDSKGRLTALSEQTASPAFSSLTATPTTLTGYGITDALSSSTTSTQDGYFGNVNLRDDTNPSHYLTITDAEDLTANRTLSLSVGNANRALTITGDATLTGSNTGDQTITLTGDVTGTGTGSFATTLKNTGTAGTYTKATFDAQGRETSGTSAVLASADFANQGTTTTVLHGNAAGNPSFGAVALGTDVSGTLAAAQFPALTGDVTTSAGSLGTTIAGNAVTDSKLRQGGALSIIGRSANSTGNDADISATAASDAVLRESGSTLGFGTIATGGIAAKAVTYAKIQDITATQRLHGRNTSGAGVTEEVTLSQLLDWVGSTAQGDILFRDASIWNRLGPGTSGQFLKTQGAGANPIWATSTGGITGPGSSTDIAFARWNGTGGATLQDSSVTWNGAAMKLGADAASPVAQTIIASGPRGGTDSNVAGAAMGIFGSPGTGTGVGGALNLGTSPAGSTGTATNASVTAMSIASTGATTFSFQLADSYTSVASTPAETLTGTWFTGGSATTTKPHMLIEPAGVTSTGWNTSGTAFGINSTSGFPGYLLDLEKNGISQLSVNVNGDVVNQGTLLLANNTLRVTAANCILWNGGAFCWTSSTAANGTTDTFLYRDAAARVQQGLDAAIPVSPQIFSSADGSGTDKNGSDRQLSGGRGTGTGRGGALIGTTSLTTTTGSSLQSESYRYYYSAKFVDLTESTATLVLNMPLATSKHVVFSIDASTNADDGTDFQNRHDILVVEGNNKAGTFTPSIAVVSSTAPTFTGTLTTSWTAVQNGNGIDIKNNATSSLAQTTLRSKFSITAIESNDTSIVVPQ